MDCHISKMDVRLLGGNLQMVIEGCREKYE